MNHDHKYFLFETKATFELLPLPTDANVDIKLPQLYERIEYAIMACNCGDVIKVKVKAREP